MEAKELMAKDWIYDGSINIQVTPENIFDIYTGNWDEPNPIPLTEEIFKANGWKKNGAYNDYILKNETYDFVGYNFDNHHLRIRIDPETGEQDLFVSVHNVHELQHALRLYGLNDLADNFVLTSH